MQYVFHEPHEYSFKDRDGHDGKFFNTDSPRTQHVIIECDDKLRVSLIQQEVEFNYYIIEGVGYFVLNGEKHDISKGNLVVVPPNTEFTFGGKLRMLLINTPVWSAQQQQIKKL